MKSGFVTIVGRPNVGKSTLLNAIMEYKVSIISSTPQTTRDQIKGVYNDEDSQIVFIDTPGIHKPKSQLSFSLNNSSYRSLEQVDAVLFLQPVNDKIGPGDRLILEKISKIKNKIAVITKVDLETDPKIIKDKAEELNALGFDNVIGTSFKYKASITQLVKEIKNVLPLGKKYYEDGDILTDKSLRFIAKEMIRESAIHFLKQEIPHSIGVHIEDFDESNPNKYQIEAYIYCERESQKGIIIGAQGRMIKRIRESAIRNMSYTFNNKVGLKIKVKVNKNWTDNHKKIQQMGY